MCREYHYTPEQVSNMTPIQVTLLLEDPDHITDKEKDEIRAKNVEILAAIESKKKAAKE